MSVLRILVIGAGYASLTALARIRRLMPAAQVTLVNRTPTWLPPWYVPQIIGGSVRAHEVSVDLAAAARSVGARFRHGNCTGLDREANVAIVDGERLAYDYCVLDLPAEPSSADVPGAELAFTLGGEASAHAIRAHVIAEIKETRDTGRADHRTFVTVGAGATGLSTAAELQRLALDAATEHLVFPDELKHVLIPRADDAVTAPTAVLRDARTTLTREGVTLVAEDAHAFTVDGVEIAGTTMPTHTIVWTADARGNRIHGLLGLALDEHGFLVVDDAYRTADTRVFAIGGSIRLRKGVHVSRDIRGHAADGVGVARTIRAVTHRERVPTTSLATCRSGAIPLRAPRAIGWFGPIRWMGAIPYRAHDRFERAWRHGVHGDARPAGI